MQYLNIEPLREQKKEALRKLGDAADAFYSAGWGEALPSRPRPGYTPDIKGPV
ncbi:MAG TPA: hypothetical protein VK638_47490 [Edaphobacter sp.]|nr:hypothetical protein [Edaphobacter sp.]